MSYKNSEIMDNGEIPSSNQVAHHVAPLQEKIGFWKNLTLSGKLSQAAADEVEKIQLKKLEAAGRVAETAIKVAEYQARAAVVSQGLTRIATMSNEVVTRAAAADNALKNTKYSAHASNMVSGHTAKKSMHSLCHKGVINEHERQVLEGLVDHDSRDSAARIERLTANAQNVVEEIASYATTGLLKAKELNFK